MNIFCKIILLFLFVPSLCVAQLTQTDNSSFKRYRSIKRALRAPESVFFLDLSGQNLQKPPQEIGKLKSLRVLNLSSNEIRELPDFIFRLPHLETLILSHNLMDSLPDSIVELRTLKKLDLQDNLFMTVPQVILQLPAISFIDLAYNSIADSEIKAISLAMPNCIIRGSPKL